ncbi:DUF4224 domain-containing protein [Neisseria sp. Ec49-e6-T10]|uniref:DUF4224 domain-containing protein n=1 Tax=Neisseria sp. Ec49-e6-T10 TaxID=3140744 RepID=UPI003EBBF7F0
MAEYLNSCLTDEDIQEITGLEQPAAQCRALDKLGVKYSKRRDGKPRTTWRLYEDAIQEKQYTVEPDFSVFAKEKQYG